MVAIHAARTGRVRHRLNDASCLDPKRLLVDRNFHPGLHQRRGFKWQLRVDAELVICYAHDRPGSIGSDRSGHLVDADRKRGDENDLVRRHLHAKLRARRREFAVQPLCSFACDLDVEFREFLLFQRGAHAALAFEAGRLHGSLGDPDPFLDQRGLARRGLDRQIGFQLRLALRGTRHFELRLGRGTRRFGLARIENDQGTIGHLRGDIRAGRGRGMRGARAFGFKRQRFAGSHVGQLAAVANTRRAVERGLARVLLRDGPRGGDRFHRCFARGLGRKLGARGIRPLSLERGDGRPLFARR